MTTQIVFGPPGTGKTTLLMGRVEDEISRGVEPEEIAFVSFTKAAVGEAKSRAMTRFGLAGKRLPWFRTLHSLAFHALALDPGAMLTDFSDFGSESGLHFSKFRGEESLSRSAPDGDVFLSARSLVASIMLPFEDIQRRYDIRLSQFRYQRLSAMLDTYKQRKDQIEYHELFQRYLKECAPVKARVAFIDEAQDLTPLQWAVVQKAFLNVERMYIAGDDDQAIYDWAGASPEMLINWPGQKIVLNESYRLPFNFQQYAEKITARIKVRHPKQWHGKKDPGHLAYYFNWNDLDFRNGESWMILARANCFVRDLGEVLERRGVLFSRYGVPSIRQDHAALFTDFLKFEDGAAMKGARVYRFLDHSLNYLKTLRSDDSYKITDARLENVRWFARWPRSRVDYLRRAFERNGTLDAKSSVELTTIHQAKGTEADNVVLSSDITASINSRMGDPEHRVFYVGVTRAKRRLFLGNPTQEHFYVLPTPT
jgi:DNA helicase-2/ATP-dependent DNA helicase PcrA